MVMDSLIPPNGLKLFSEQAIQAIQEELVYWNAGVLMAHQSRDSAEFPIPIKLYRHKGKNWEDFGQYLIDHGLANFGDVDFSHPDFKLNARLMLG